MPFQGNGLFTRVYQWVNDEVLGLNVDATRTDTDSNDIAAGLSNCVTRNGQSPWLANLPAGGFKITGLAAGSADNDSIRYAQLFKSWTANLNADGKIIVNLGAGTAPGDSVNFGQVFNGGTFNNATFTGNTNGVTPPGSDNSTLFATTAYVTAKAFSAALPAQPGGTTVANHLYTLGGSAAWGRIYETVNIVTVSDTWTCPVGVTRTEVWATGGGAACSTGGNAIVGATAGSTGMKVFTVVPGTVYTRTVGAGGAAVLAATTAGNAGGTSSFSGSGITTLSCPGGPANISGAVDGAPGLPCTGADISIPGGVGTGAVNNVKGGVGGSSFWCGNTAINTSALGYGGGSGGGFAITTGYAGAAGVIVQRY